MRTPFGTECPYFYGDYYRGKSQEECRLIGILPSPGNWTRDLCKTCPVPSIHRANACENMSLTAKISRKFPLGKRSVQITAYCSKVQGFVKEPKVGCGFCHSLGEIQTKYDKGII